MDHQCSGGPNNANTLTGNQVASSAVTQQSQEQDAAQKQQASQPVISPDPKKPIPYGQEALTQEVDCNLAQQDSKGNVAPAANASDHKLELREKIVEGNGKGVTLCQGQCKGYGTLPDEMTVTRNRQYTVEKRFTIDGNAAKVYDPQTKKLYDYIRVGSSVKNGFVFQYGNNPHP